MLARWCRVTAVFRPIIAAPKFAVAEQQRHLQSLPGSLCYEDDQHTIRDSSLPKPVWECLHQLRAAGHEVFVVGGAVRDILLENQEPKDFDLLTSAQLQKVRELFQHHRPRVIGRNFPICQLDVKGIRIEVSSMHTRPATKPWAAAAAPAGVPADVAEHLLGSGTAPGRGRRSCVLPHVYQQQQQSLSWAAARRANAAARDFTVNALLYEPFQRVVFDYVGGMTDLAAKQLRCVGDATIRFQADPACLLRAVRCAARAGLQLEAVTLSALQQHAKLAATLNAQRITAELMAMLSYGAAASSLLLLHQTRLLQQVLPLHHQHMQRQLKQHGGGQSNHSSSRRRLTRFSTNTHADQTEAGAVSDSVFCQPSADSALGQMLHDLTQQQQQQLPAGTQSGTWQQAEQQQSPQRLTSAGRDQVQTNKSLQQVSDQQQVLLLRVAAALDEHVGVKQPAAAEVVLACLTAPLVLEAIQDAVAQLQYMSQQQQQRNSCSSHCQEQHTGLERVEQQEQQIKSYVRALDDVMQQHSSVKQIMWGKCIVDNSSAAQQQQITMMAAAAARGISTDSSKAFVRDRSKVTKVGLSPAAEQLLLGSGFREVVRQQALHFATQVCRMSSDVAADSVSSQLFGVHSPAQAAALLVAHVDVCQRMRLLSQAGHRPAVLQGSKQLLRHRTQTLQHVDHRGKALSQRQHSSSKGLGQLSTSTPASQQLDTQVVDCEEAYPRTNKQYRRLMARQRHGAYQQQHSAGDLRTIPSKAILAAAAEAVYGADWQQESFEDARSSTVECRREQHSNLVAGVALDSSEHMVHNVLAAACAGFDTMEAAVADLLLHKSGAW